MNRRKRTPLFNFPLPPVLPAIITRKRPREEQAAGRKKTGTDAIWNLGSSESRREEHHFMHCDPSAAQGLMGSPPPPPLVVHDRKPEQEEISRRKEVNDGHEVEKGRRKGNYSFAFNRNLTNFECSGLETSIRVHLRTNDDERCGEEERKQLHQPQYDEKEEEDKYEEEEEEKEEKDENEDEDEEEEEGEENKYGDDGDDKKANEEKDDKMPIPSPGISAERWCNGENSLPYIKRKSIYRNHFETPSRFESEKDAASTTSSSIHILADLTDNFEEEEEEEDPEEEEQAEEEEEPEEPEEEEEEEPEEEEEEEEPEEEEEEEATASSAASTVELTKSPNSAERWPKSASDKEGKEESRGDATIITSYSTSEKSNGSASNPGSDQRDEMLLFNAAMELALGFPTNPQQSNSAEDDLEMEVVEENEDLYSIVKRRHRHVTTTMPGACNRMNGNGWRCRRPTPPGYSLCERHRIGRRRRRSYGDTRAAQILYTCKKTGEDAVVKRKKRSKRPKVKTRSIASLLAETQPVKIKY